jgi:tryptophan synthase alpha chain
VGLGVSTAAQAKEVAGFADGVIVGSAFVRRLAAAQDAEQAIADVRTLTADLAHGVRRTR